MIKVVKKYFVVLFVVGSGLAISACSTSGTVDIKSPCVSLEEGPCGPKRSVNDWWIKANT